MRKHQKGMTVVEVVVAFALISLSAAIGMVGIASGASLLHAGATLKKERSQIELPDTAAETVVVVHNGSNTTYTVTESSSAYFKAYTAASP